MNRRSRFYTHISDQYSIFGTRVISCSPREALYVFDGLLENDTILRPREDYTDTHGFTEQLFGLRDLADQQLYMHAIVGMASAAVSLRGRPGFDPRTGGTN
jgi:TnpA family transposase